MTEADLFFHNELWHCYEVHSDLSQPNKETMLSNLNRLLTEMNSKLAAATHLFITYGTSWVYQLKASNAVVANCHKVAQDQFEKVIISGTEIENAIQNSIYLIQKLNLESKTNYLNKYLKYKKKYLSLKKYTRDI